MSGTTSEVIVPRSY